MLGPNPRKAVGTPTPSSTEFPQKTIITTAQSTNGGLMVKAMDEIFRHVEEAEHPDSFKVIHCGHLFNFISKLVLDWMNIMLRSH